MFSQHARRGLPGVKALRIALEWWRPNEAVTHSKPELDLIQILRDHGIEAVPQYRVHDEHGNFVAQVDAGLPQWRIAVEYESDQEHLDEFQIARDDKRRNEIMAAGFWPLAARKHDVRHGALDLVEQIRRIARRNSKPA
jgi:very-short-patch-repair endonuclease